MCFLAVVFETVWGKWSEKPKVLNGFWFCPGLARFAALSAMFGNLGSPAKTFKGNDLYFFLSFWKAKLVSLTVLGAHLGGFQD